MHPERWQSCTEIFNVAVEQPPDERAAFLERSCDGDEALRRKVELLLKYHDAAGDFIKSPAFEIAPELLVGDPEALIGQRLGCYRVDAVAGIGGMGVVYLACDERLGRKVALKLLPQSMVANETTLGRLKHEARTASALNHPNIVTIHEIGEADSTHYIAAEFIEGTTLRERMTKGSIPLQEALDIATQVASALCAAHRASIVHRDIKPENIMLRPDGYVKVLDFGIAKLAESAFAEPPSHRFGAPGATPNVFASGRAEGAESMTLAETNLGSILGTVRYMSPEQTCGAPVDRRTDIWSLGIVLYEMVTGHAPFTGDPPSQSEGAVGTPQDVMFSIVEKEPPPLARYMGRAPAELQQIISKTLRKDREERYQSAHELLEDLKGLRRKLEFKGELERSTAGPLWLRWTRSPAVIAFVLFVSVLALALPFYWHRNLTTNSPPEKSIAVLPFANLSEEKANAYFAEGIQNEILTRLSKIADLKVISRTSTAKYPSKPEDLKTVSQQLGVAHVLEGSVQKAADKVRVNVQLIDARADSHLWARTYDRDLKDVFAVESEVAQAIADYLQARITGTEAEVLAAKPTSNPQAYDNYLRGLAFFSKTTPTPVNMLGAQKHFREATHLDAGFALAWALLSTIDSRGYLTGSLPHTPALRDEAQQAAERAIQLQPSLGEAILARAFFYYACLRDFNTAESYLTKARPFLPNSSRIPELQAYLTKRRGQWERSEAYFAEAERLDPRNVAILTQHGFAHLNRRNFPQALRKFDQVLDITANDMDTLANKASVAQATGDLAQAATLLAPLRPNAEDFRTLEIQVYQSFLERRPGSMIARLQEILAKPDPSLGYLNGELRVLLGWAHSLAGDQVAATAAWEAARREMESFLAEQPDNARLLDFLAVACAGLGDKAAAFGFVERANGLVPPEKDVLDRPRNLDMLAWVAAQTGETAQAVATLEKLITTPYEGMLQRPPLTPALLRLDPRFDPLRGDPRFEKLVEEAKQPIALEPVEKSAPKKSIAVLPFDNLSKDEENAFFAGGVQDEILTRLARIADLKVISRTSVMLYKSGNLRNLREIGKQLGVAHLLEGSVQRSKNRVRVVAHLIDARTDAHLWAQTYDRDLADVFAIQSEIAKAIADQLQAKLSPNEKKAIEQPPTTDLAAFDLYSRAGTILLTRRFSSASAKDVRQAIELLDQAVKRDPSFFDAYCQLAYAHELLYAVLGVDHTPARLAQTEAALQAATRLRPAAGETHLARAEYLYYGLRDYAGALAELESARRTLPNDPRTFELSGYILRRRGQQKEGVRNLERAIELDPRNFNTLQQIALSYQRLRRFAEAITALDRALSIVPDNIETKAVRALFEFFWKADTRPLHRTIDSILAQGPGAIAPAADAWFICALVERDPAAAGRALVAAGDNPCWSDAVIQLSRSFGEGLLARMMKDEARALSAFGAARAEQEKIVQAQPDYGPALCVLGLIDAALGRKEAALEEGRRAIELVPMEKDIINGSHMIQYFAITATWAGEKDLALQQLELGLRAPAASAALSYGTLKLHPFWDSLRGDPRFERIVASLAPKDAAAK